MNKLFFLYLITLLQLITNNKNETNDTNDTIEENNDNLYGDDFYGYFNESLKDYLIKNKLYNSERKIEHDEMKKIFFDVVTEGGPESSPKQLRKLFEKLADFFIEKYYNETKQIRGKDIYKLIDINEIYEKFNEFVVESPLYGYFDGEEEEGKEEKEENVDINKGNNINNDL